MQYLFYTKIQKAVLVSIFSFVSMFTLLWVFPSKAEKQNSIHVVKAQEKSRELPELSFHNTPVEQNSKEKPSYTREPNFFKTDYFLSLHPSVSEKGYFLSNGPLSFTLNHTFTFRNIQPNSLIFDSLSPLGNYFLQMNYQITPYLSTEINIAHQSISFLNNPQYSSISTGIQIKANKYLTTTLLTGESFFYINPTRNQNLTYLENLNLRQTELKNNFELRTEIRPTKNLFFQTAFYNTEQSFDEINSNQGTKFVFGYGYDFIQLNLKYNYISNQLFKNGRLFENNPQTKDAGGFGITIFLDKGKNFSLYLGNNYFNLFNSPKYEDKTATVPYITSYAASLRGRALQRGFLFLNFRNQINKDIQYYNFGTMQIPRQSIFQDTATSLGLELWF